MSDQQLTEVELEAIEYEKTWREDAIEWLGVVRQSERYIEELPTTQVSGDLMQLRHIVDSGQSKLRETLLEREDAKYWEQLTKFMKPLEAAKMMAQYSISTYGTEGAV